MRSAFSSDLAPFFDATPPSDLDALPSHLQDGITSCPGFVLHLFSCGCAERALLREASADRPLPSAAWDALAAKRLFIEGDLSLYDADFQRLSLRSRLDDARALAHDHPTQGGPWASLVALECLYHALSVTETPIRIARITSIHALRSAISSARASVPPRSAILAAEEERLWQQAHLHSWLDQVAEKRRSLLALLRFHPSHLHSLRQYRDLLETALF